MPTRDTDLNVTQQHDLPSFGGEAPHEEVRRMIELVPRSISK